MTKVKQLLKSFYVRTKDLYHLNLFGTIGGLLGFIASLSPSLIPRPAFFMGLLAGIGFMVGYGLGVLVQKTYYWLLDQKIPKSYSNLASKIILWSVFVVALIFAILANSWQNEIRQLVGAELVAETGILLIILGFFIMMTLILVVSRAIRRLFMVSVKRTRKINQLPNRLAILIGSILGFVLVLAVVDGVFLNTVRVLANDYFGVIDSQTNDGVVQPTSPLRSGSQDSLVEWSTLGRHGRSFTGLGPTSQDITQFTGRPAKEPIRVFVSAAQADSPRGRAELAVEELVRTGAFDRKVLVVSTTTGSGWVEPASAAAVEYLHDGDTAQVALQYSYLPSWMALLAEQQAATDSGKALFEAVSNKLRQIPEGQRPKVITSGLSLGAFGSQAAFSGASDFALRTDGALYFGNPGFSQPWRNFTENRDPGSRQIKPLYRGGEIVRFANNQQDLAEVGEGWGDTRVLFVQYASDAIVWWTPDLIWRQPDWFNEERGSDVSDRVHWFPVISFFQITFDQMLGNHFTGGHGHNYAPVVVQSWAAVTPVEGWAAEQLEQLQDLMNYRYTTVSPGKDS